MTKVEPTRPEPEVEEAFDRLVEEGQDRLERPLPALIGTAILGGIDVGTGVLAYMVVDHETHSSLLAGIAFGIGFIALLLARSELFTENFLVPVTAVIARRGTLAQMGRLWLIALAGNLVGGWVFMWLITEGLPQLHPVERQLGEHYAALGFNLRSFVLAILGGTVITLMTRMQHSTDSLGVKIVPAVICAFLLAGGELFHSVLNSLYMFSGLQAGASYGYGRWFLMMCWGILGNMIGGLVLVTGLRMLRVPHRVAEERKKNLS